MYRAPWDRWFSTFLCKGQTAYELQVGPVVFMRFYRGSPRHFTMWRDRAWRGR